MKVRINIMCHGDGHNLIMIMELEEMMTKIMIVKNCLLLQNLQAFLDLEIIAEETDVVVMVDDNKVTLLLKLHMKTDRKLWQLADIGNNAPDKLIFDECQFLQIFVCTLIIMMLV